MPKPLHQTGFSLLELLCCLCLIAIMIAYGIGTYSNWLRKAQRSDAKRSLEYWATRLEQRSVPRQRLLSGVISLQGLYRITLLPQKNGNYILEAYPIRQQTIDKDCPLFRLDSFGRHIAQPGC